ncbi:hypothetical protein [Helicovermis profundi]|uniref:Lipoprotein n=1 Tax=Helicovermis profundi TaxID=3065157 RepID=A0AAU9EP68_9FIRM|nr:hypothetical protein HLPR_05860 [Clostridia bacterium S502]
MNNKSKYKFLSFILIIVILLTSCRINTITNHSNSSERKIISDTDFISNLYTLERNTPKNYHLNDLKNVISRKQTSNNFMLIPLLMSENISNIANKLVKNNKGHYILNIMDFSTFHVFHVQNYKKFKNNLDNFFNYDSTDHFNPIKSVDSETMKALSPNNSYYLGFCEDIASIYFSSLLASGIKIDDITTVFVDKHAYVVFKYNYNYYLLDSILFKINLENKSTISKMFGSNYHYVHPLNFPLTRNKELLSLLDKPLVENFKDTHKTNFYELYNVKYDLKFYKDKNKLKADLFSSNEFESLINNVFNTTIHSSGKQNSVDYPFLEKSIRDFDSAKDYNEYIVKSVYELSKTDKNLELEKYAFRTLIVNHPEYYLKTKLQTIENKDSKKDYLINFFDTFNSEKDFLNYLKNIKNSSIYSGKYKRIMDPSVVACTKIGSSKDRALLLFYYLKYHNETSKIIFTNNDTYILKENGVIISLNESNYVNKISGDIWLMMDERKVYYPKIGRTEIDPNGI